MDIRKDIYADEMQRIEDDMVPFGFINGTLDDAEEQDSFHDGENFWQVAKESEDPFFYK